MPHFELKLFPIVLLASCTAWSEPPPSVPAPLKEAPPAATAATETAVLAGGCFWGVEGVFEHVEGVTDVRSGYAGGNAATATYEQVGSGATGHAEAVQIRYDPKKVTYGQLLQIFFAVAHDPTELNRQGPDVGTQYRSSIFPMNGDQEKIARAYLDQLRQAKTFGKAPVTTVEPSKAFYAAEPYHQDFLERHPNHPYIVANDLPKVDALKRLFPARYRAKPK